MFLRTRFLKWLDRRIDARIFAHGAHGLNVSGDSVTTERPDCGKTRVPGQPQAFDPEDELDWGNWNDLDPQHYTDENEDIAMPPQNLSFNNTPDDAEKN